MFASSPASTWSKLQLPGLVLAIAAIVIAPFLLSQTASQTSRDAQRLVAH